MAAPISFQMRLSCGCAFGAYVLVYKCTRVHRTRVHTTGEPGKGKNAHNSPACTPAARLHARLHACQLLVTRRCSYARSRCCIEQEYTLPENQRRAKTHTSNRCSRCVAVALLTKKTHLSVLSKAYAMWCCACHIFGIYIFGYMACPIISYSITWYSMMSQEEYDMR